jgi:hypothetical protein
MPNLRLSYNRENTMNRTIRLVLMSSMALVVLLAAAPLAHDGDEHRILGTVTMAAADHVMLRTTDNKDVTVMITKDTRVTRNRQKMRPEDIKPRTRVVVTAITNKGVTHATVIEVGPDPKASGNAS